MIRRGIYIFRGKTMLIFWGEGAFKRPLLYKVKKPCYWSIYLETSQVRRNANATILSTKEGKPLLLLKDWYQTNDLSHLRQVLYHYTTKAFTLMLIKLHIPFPTFRHFLMPVQQTTFWKYYDKRRNCSKWQQCFNLFIFSYYTLCLEILMFLLSCFQICLL